MAEEDPRRHADVWSMLPLLVSGRATPAQRALAEAHLAACPDCRADLARERVLAQAFALPPPALPTAETGLRRLMERLDHVAEDQSARAPVPARRRWVGVLAAVGLLELVLLGSLVAAWRPAAEAPYRTLTAGETRVTDGPRWRVMFDDQMSLQDLQALLRLQGLRVEAGPSESGVFTVAAAVPPADPDALAARLRRLPQVRFAETVPAPR